MDEFEEEYDGSELYTHEPDHDVSAVEEEPAAVKPRKRTYRRKAALTPQQTSKGSVTARGTISAAVLEANIRSAVSALKRGYSCNMEQDDLRTLVRSKLPLTDTNVKAYCDRIEMMLATDERLEKGAELETVYRQRVSPTNDLIRLKSAIQMARFEVSSLRSLKTTIVEQETFLRTQLDELRMARKVIDFYDDTADNEHLKDLAGFCLHEQKNMLMAAIASTDSNRMDSNRRLV